ncbi:MAG: C39 family peptidase [Anaerolineae bacterium]
MSKRTKTIILAVAFVQIAMILFLLVVPPLVRALPGAVRVRLARVPLGETLLDIGVTPLPTVLPAPANGVARSEIVIPTAGIPTATATEILTAVPTQVSNTAVTPLPTTQPTNTPAPTASPTAVPLPRQARVDGLKIMPQGFNNCGPANLTINLNFYGNATTQAEAAGFLKPNREDRNVSPWQMVDYVNEQTNLRAFVGSGGDLELIKRFLANDLPIVIEKGYELPTEGWLGHYLTMFAYDDDKQEFLSLDTNLGPWDGSGRVDSYETVNTYWQQFNYTFFVVYPLEKEALVQELLGQEMLDTATMWRQAAEQAQTEIDADPKNAFAWFNLGTSLTRLGEMSGDTAFYENGAAAFDQARIIGVPPRIVWYQFRPYIAYMKVGRFQEMVNLADTTLTTQGGRNVEETYLYKGHALAFLGDGPGAVAAYEDALRLNSNFYPAQWALDSITGG